MATRSIETSLNLGSTAPKKGSPKASAPIARPAPVFGGETKESSTTTRCIEGRANHRCPNCTARPTAFG